MDSEQFNQASQLVSKFVVDYMENLRGKPVLANVQPGYLENNAEDECPTSGIEFAEIFAEFQKKILPGVTHWASPHFHSYFPAGNCYPSILAEFLIAGLNNVGVHWESSPALAELEMVVLNWLGKMMNLPKEFLNCFEGPGGGVLQNTSTECTLLSLVAARNQAVKKWKLLNPELTGEEIVSKLVSYSSIQAHSSVERISSITMLRSRVLECDKSGKVTGETFASAIREDIADGLIPFYMVSTMGATTTCSWDHLDVIGAICRENDIWLHIDAAYAGAALVCPELRYIAHGLEFANSFAVGLHKWFLMSFDAVAYWLKDTTVLADALSVDRVYLHHKHQGKAADFVHLQIGTGRKFKALKIWMVLKNYGVRGVQEHIRRHVMLGNYMEQLIGDDRRFEVINSGLGLVVFALKSGDAKTEVLRTQLNDAGRISLTPSHFNGRYVIRFSPNFSTRVEDVEYAWKLIRTAADGVVDVEYTKEDIMDVLHISKVDMLDRYLDEVQV